jgi:hypothetical protein
MVIKTEMNSFLCEYPMRVLQIFKRSMLIIPASVPLEITNPAIPPILKMK